MPVTLSLWVDVQTYKAGRGLLVAALSFAATGTITAVWTNPFFTRMTAIGS